MLRHKTSWEWRNSSLLGLVQQPTCQRPRTPAFRASWGRKHPEHQVSGTFSALPWRQTTNKEGRPVKDGPVMLPFAPAVGCPSPWARRALQTQERGPKYTAPEESDQLARSGRRWLCSGTARVCEQFSGVASLARQRGASSRYRRISHRRRASPASPSPSRSVHPLPGRCTKQWGG